MPVNLQKVSRTGSYRGPLSGRHDCWLILSACHLSAFHQVGVTKYISIPLDGRESRTLSSAIPSQTLSVTELCPDRRCGTLRRSTIASTGVVPHKSHCEISYTLHVWDLDPEANSLLIDPCLLCTHSWKARMEHPSLHIIVLPVSKPLRVCMFHSISIPAHDQSFLSSLMVLAQSQDCSRRRDSVGLYAWTEQMPCSV